MNDPKQATGIRAIDVPVIRQEILRWMTTESYLEYEDGSVHPQLRGSGMNRQMATRHRVGVIQHADLFMVSREMTRLAEQAAKTLPVFEYTHEDLPSHTGLLLFEEPLCEATHDDADDLSFSVDGFTWAETEKRIVGMTGVPQHSGIFCQPLTKRDDMLDRMVAAGQCDLRDADAQRRIMPTFVPLLHRTMWLPFGNRVIGDGVMALAESFLGLRAAWLLMQQPIADVSPVTADRATRKRLARIGESTDSTRIIKLRRSVRAGGGDGVGDREYSHQWIVRGHWRQQWHPARRVHRPAWIAPHVKGPEGKPMLGGEKVYHLAR